MGHPKVDFNVINFLRGSYLLEIGGDNPGAEKNFLMGLGGASQRNQGADAGIAEEEAAPDQDSGDDGNRK
jgi:hypothetical protein